MLYNYIHSNWGYLTGCFKNTPSGYGGRYPQHMRIRAFAINGCEDQSVKTKRKAYKVADFDGLYINVSKSGSRLWRFKFRIDGKEGLLSFGRYPDISLSEARQMRDEARKKVVKGINPAKAKQAAKTARLSKTEHTFAKFAEKFLAKQMKEGKSEETIKKKEWLLRLAMDDLGDMPINDIKAQTVLKILKKREALGHYETVKRMRSTISAVFRFAVA